jgi:hypothetical protein
MHDRSKILQNHVHATLLSKGFPTIPIVGPNLPIIFFIEIFNNSYTIHLNITKPLGAPPTHWGLSNHIKSIMRPPSGLGDLNVTKQIQHVLSCWDLQQIHNKLNITWEAELEVSV